MFESMSGSVSEKYVSASEDAFCYVTALRPVIMWKCGSIHFDVRPTQLVQHLIFARRKTPAYKVRKMEQWEAVRRK